MANGYFQGGMIVADSMVEICTQLSTNQAAALFRDSLQNVYASWSRRQQRGTKLKFGNLTVARDVFDTVDGLPEPSFAAVATFYSPLVRNGGSHIQAVIYDYGDHRLVLINPVSQLMLAGKNRKIYVEPILAAFKASDPHATARG